jgi:guanylate kinase
LSREAFEDAAAAGQMLEWVEYGGNLYGTLRTEVEARLARGFDVILEIELQGARAVRRQIPEAVAIFIAPPDLEELARRLRGRGTESDAAIARRLAIAATEVEAAREFNAVVLNDDADRAAAEVVNAIEDRRAALAAVPTEKE